MALVQAYLKDHITTSIDCLNITAVVYRTPCRLSDKKIINGNSVSGNNDMILQTVSQYQGKHPFNETY